MFGIKKIFNDLWLDGAYSRPLFPAFRRGFRLKREFLSAVSSRFAIDTEILFPKIKDALEKGRLSPSAAAAICCVNSNTHDRSKFDSPDFLYNFISLSNATTWQECCKIEGIRKDDGTNDYENIQAIGTGTGPLSRRLEEIKIYCWKRDLDRATRPNWLDKVLGRNQNIKISDVDNILGSYNQTAAQELDKKNIEKKKVGEKPDYLAFPKEDFIPLLKKAKRRGDLSETQCGIMLMFFLHSLEKRNGGESYTKHPVSVAGLVKEFGYKYFGEHKDGRIWKAIIVALLHDGWEENGIDSINENLHGLLLKDIIEAIKCLHKTKQETYFKYLERVASNQLASLVKLCDTYNNSSDRQDNPTSKQAFVYKIAANYLDYRLKNPDDKISVEEFVKQNNICSEKDFYEINQMTETSAKKQPASNFPHLQKALHGVNSVKEILSRDKSFYAHPRREENPSLQH